MAEQAPRIEETAYAQQEVDDKPQDECGVTAIYAPDLPVGAIVYDALQALQHRGPSGAGIAYYEPMLSGLMVHKGFHEVAKALSVDIGVKQDGTTAIDDAKSPVAIGHVRYSTDESESRDALHPHLGSRSGIALAHNGHIEHINAVAERFNVPVSPGDSDSAILTQILDQEAERRGSLDEALDTVLPHVDGAYCLVMTDGKRVIAVRDPWGTHPLSWAQLPDGQGQVIASEPVAFQGLGAIDSTDVRAGEIMTFGPDGIASRFLLRQEQPRQCMYEFVYIARPDSEFDNVNIYQARENMGRYLAEDHPVDADVLIGVPDSGLAAAAGFALVASGIPKVEAIFRNRYASARTFMHRGDTRQSALAKKFHLNVPKIEGQRVGLIDDSLIKGNTTKALIGQLREAGATEVHVRLAAPRYVHPCYGGMDTRDVWRLIAREHSDEEIADLIHADSVAFNSVARVEQAVFAAQRQAATQRQLGSLCTACATGAYPYKVPEITQLAAPRLRPTTAIVATGPYGSRVQS